MLSETVASLFNLTNNFVLEIMAALALIWSATLLYLIVRKVSGLIKRSHTSRAEADACGELAEVAAER